MSLENSERTYGSVAEYNRQQDEREYGNGGRESMASNVNFNEYFYESVDITLDSLQKQLKEYKDIISRIDRNHDNMYMENPYMSDETQNEIDKEVFTAKSRIFKLFGSVQAEYDKVVNDLVCSLNMNDRIYAAKKGLEPERLAKDPTLEVRLAVAETGQCLDILAKDIKPVVRRVVVRQTDDPDILKHLANDDDRNVMESAISKLNYLDTIPDPYKCTTNFRDMIYNTIEYNKNAPVQPFELGLIAKSVVYNKNHFPLLYCYFKSGKGVNEIRGMPDEEIYNVAIFYGGTGNTSKYNFKNTNDQFKLTYADDGRMCLEFPKDLRQLTEIELYADTTPLYNIRTKENNATIDQMFNKVTSPLTKSEIVQYLGGQAAPAYEPPKDVSNLGVSYLTYLNDEGEGAIIAAPLNTMLDNISSCEDFYDNGKWAFIKSHPEITEEIYNNTEKAVYEIPSVDTLARDIVAVCEGYGPKEEWDKNEPYAIIEYGLFRVVLYEGESEDTGMSTHYANIFTGRAPSETAILAKEAKDVQVAEIHLTSINGKMNISDVKDILEDTFKDSRVKSEIDEMYSFESEKHNKANTKERDDLIKELERN